MWGAEMGCGVLGVGPVVLVMLGVVSLAYMHVYSMNMDVTPVSRPLHPAGPVNRRFVY